VALFPDTDLASLLALVPVANIALAVRDLLTGTLHWPLALLAWAVTAGAALWVCSKTTHLLASERLVTAMEHDADIPLHGPARFPAHVLRWYALLWALVVIAGNYLSTPQWVPVQLLLNPLGFFLGGSLLLIRGYRLNIREAIPLRPVRPLVWLAVLVAAPCAVVAGLGLEQLVNLVMPIPPEWLSNDALLHPLGSMPLWGQLLLLAVLPGICEEIAFRGLLLYGLHKSLRPAALAVTVGVVFALFHFLIFRLPTTAALGILLAAVTLLTGSILPSILWHIINNTLAVLLGSASGLVMKLNPATYVVATALLALCMYIIYRNRTVYPGLKR
jgi:membrane protease YdiL (CAAX protease family)